jgi:N-acetylmuramoyl-L-alanine amidase
MSRWLACFAALLWTAVAPMAIAQDAEDVEETMFSASSSAFLESREESIAFLRDSKIIENLAMPSLGAMTSSDFNLLVAAIKAEPKIPEISAGDPREYYDVILQPGHYGRTSGATGASGVLVSERALVSFVTARIASDLRARGLKTLVVPADGYLRNNAQTPEWDGLRGTVFIAVHADGSVAKCNSGPSLGYAPNTSPHEMHVLAVAMAQALGYRYSDFLRDNFTANVASYYMFKHVPEARLRGLIEIGEVTCEKDEKEMIGNADSLAKNIAYSLHFLLSMPSSQ